MRVLIDTGIKSCKQWSNNISDGQMKYLTNKESLNKNDTGLDKNESVESNLLLFL